MALLSLPFSQLQNALKVHHKQMTKKKTTLQGLVDREAQVSLGTGFLQEHDKRLLGRLAMAQTDEATKECLCMYLVLTNLL